MAKPEFAMSMFASKADLFEAKANYFEQQLKKLRDEVKEARDQAANPAPYMHPSDYDAESGKEFAYDEVLYSLNKVLNDE